MRIVFREITAERVIDAAKRRLEDIPDALSWRRSVDATANRRRLERYRGVHRGRRCFIMANGPSLARMDLAPLRDEITMSMNRAYLLYDQWGFRPTYFLSINELVLEQFASDIARLTDVPRFVNFNRRRCFSGSEGDDTLMYLRFGFGLQDRFSGDITRTLSSGGTVTFACLQVAYFMGFSEVVLIGLDHSFVEKGVPNKTVVRREEKDESHCHPAYFPKGVKWQLPDLYRSELAYALARQAYEADGRRIFDATVGGRCEIFEKKAFNECFDRRGDGA